MDSVPVPTTKCVACVVLPSMVSAPAPPVRVTLPGVKPLASSFTASVPRLRLVRSALLMPDRLVVSSVAWLASAATRLLAVSVRLKSRAACNVSVPPPPTMESLPPWVISRSLPVPPSSVSLPTVPPSSVTPPRVKACASSRLSPTPPVMLAPVMLVNVSVSAPLVSWVLVRVKLASPLATSTLLPVPPSMLSLALPATRKSSPAPPFSVAATPPAASVSSPAEPMTWLKPEMKSKPVA